MLFIADYFISNYPQAYLFAKNSVMCNVKNALIHGKNTMKYNETQLPKEKFFSKLKNKGITDEDNKHA